MKSFFLSLGSNIDPISNLNSAINHLKNIGIEICEIKKIDNAPAGIFNLYNKTANFELATENNEALVLHTSGTCLLYTSDAADE